MEIQKECANCYFYKDLYFIYKARFRKACGFCSNKEVYRYCTNNSLHPKPCAKWKPKPIIVEEERENIGKVLKDIRKSLKEISQVLNESENQS